MDLPPAAGVPDGAAAPAPRALLVAPRASYRIADYARAALSLGLTPCLASEGHDALVPDSGVGLAVNLSDRPAALARLLDESRRAPFAAVVATDDATVELAAELAAALNLPHNPPAAAQRTRRKDLARAALAAAGLPVPAFRTLDLRKPLSDQIRDLAYPAVVKPLALSGSRGVIRVDDAVQLARAVERVRPILAEARLEGEERHRVLVEDYLPGIEFALEGVLADGRLQPVALFDKPDPLEGPYFEETYYVTPSRLAVSDQARIRERVEAGCRALGLREGPVHAEVRFHRGEAWILEIASRTIGGQCARLLRFGSGATLESLVLRRACGMGGEPPRLRRAAGVLMIPIPGGGVLRRVEGVLAASAVAGVEEIEISVREGHVLVPLPEGESYLGFIFATGDTPATVEAALRAAHACLRVVVAPLLPLERAG